MAAPAVVTAEPAASEPTEVTPLPQEPTPSTKEDFAAAAPLDERWVDEVHAVVAQYRGWGRVDDEMRWAPWLCRMPRPATARISESDDPSTHGRKLYTLYAMDPVAYGAQPTAMAMGEGGGPVDGLRQVIVKESFSPVPWDEAQDPDAQVWEQRLQPAVRDGERFVPGEPQGLFVMMQVKGDVAGTDAGWIYATVEPTGQRVTAVGAIDGCMGCHQQAGDGRLFGLHKPAAEPQGHQPKANAVPL